MTDRNYVEKRSQNHSNTDQFQIEIGCNVEVSNGRRYLEVEKLCVEQRGIE